MHFSYKDSIGLYSFFCVCRELVKEGKNDLTLEHNWDEPNLKCLDWNLFGL